MVQFIKILCTPFIEHSFRSKSSTVFTIITFALVITVVVQMLLLCFGITEMHPETKKSSREMRRPDIYQEGPALVRELSTILIPPTKKGHVSTNDLPFPSKLIEELRALTDYKEGGYFVEIGAGNKNLFSDSLFLERHMGWSGLLVEPDIITMKVFRRNAWIAPACVSLNYSSYEFHRQPYIRYQGHDRRGVGKSPIVMCYPFYAFWLALNRPMIDYLALDVGGGELEILETIPFDKVDIKIVHVDYTKARGGFMGVTTFMQLNGYKVVSDILPHFLFFIKKEYVNHYNEI